jgi:5-methylcytosine-specific restriction protein A
MALKELTRESVEKAITTFDQLGRDKFLAKYGYKRAKGYFILLGGRSYDSKAIAGVAYGFVRPDLGPLKWDDFGGGERTVRQRLEKLGFSITSPENRNPDWSKDELIVALDFYFRHREHIPGKTSREIAELSAQLNALAGTLRIKGDVTFRNINGVYMKLMNFLRLDPDYISGGGVGLSRGGKADEIVWQEFARDPSRLRHVAQTILEVVSSDRSLHRADEVLVQGDDPDTAEAPEGAIITRMHRGRERSRKLIDRKKADALAKRGRLACEVCRFDFRKAYGERGHGYAECHHTKPLAQYSPGQKTLLTDLAIVCANCHRMIHRKAPWLSLDQLKELLR